MKLLFENWRKYVNEEIVMPPPGFLEGSIYKAPLYHGSDYQLKADEYLDPNHGDEYGIYLSPNKKYAKMYGQNLYETFVNIQNPIYVEGKHEVSPKDLTSEDIQKIKNEGHDSIVVSNDGIENASEIVVFDPEQVHVLERR